MSMRQGTDSLRVHVGAGHALRCCSVRADVCSDAAIEGVLHILAGGEACAPVMLAFKSSAQLS